MPIQQSLRRLLSLAACLLSGCALSPDAKKSADTLAVGQNAADAAAATNTSPTTPAQATTPLANTVGSAPAVSTPGQSTAKTATPAAPDPRVLDDVLAELAELGPVQPEAQKRLIEDLRKTDPAYWPMLVQTFRATLEYRRRSTQKVADERLSTPGDTAATAHGEVVQVAATEAINETATPPGEGMETAVSRNTAEVATVAPNNPASEIPQSAPAGGAPAASKDGAATIEWRRHLEAAIADLDRQTREQPNDPDALANQVYLRLLDLAAGRRDDALKPMAGLPAAQQDYWANQLYALSTYLDRGASDPAQRAAEASVRLTRAAAMLGEQGTLLVRNLTFCTHVHSYGVLERFDPAEFHTGQQVLLYAEIENFKSDETAQGFHTSLEASYEILDRQGNRVAHDELPRTEEHCQNRRRDFFVRYFLALPKTIYEGSYTLKLTIEDKLARKIGQSSIDFVVKQK